MPPHSINIVVRRGSTPRPLVFIVCTAKILGSMINERENTAGAFTCSTFSLHTTCVQTCGYRTEYLLRKIGDYLMKFLINLIIIKKC